MLRYRILKKLDRLLRRTIARCYVCGRRLSSTEYHDYENACEHCISSARQRMESQNWSGYVMAAALVLYIAFGIGMLYRTDVICTMQTDMMDQIMETQQELDQMKWAPVQADSPEVFPAYAMPFKTDYELICRVVAAEARGEGYEGQLAVAQVIRDRARMWGMTPENVVIAPNQFTKPYQGEIGPETMAAVNDCLIGGVSAFERPVTHFCEVSMTPYWADGKEIAGVIGNHRFYR